jgi:NAD(P)-dependent dehydrogenase (short-subunit alcohol dehydrogenase family)
LLEIPHDQFRSSDVKGDNMSSSVLEGKKVLITGGSAGIGAALAVAMAQAGAVVGICARRAGLLEKVVQTCREGGGDAHAWVVDLARLNELEGFVRRAEEELDGIDMLVNNAGIPKRRAIARLTPAEVDLVMTVNYLAPVHLTLAVLPAMLARGEGRIFNVASVASRLGGSGESAYAASKAALGVWSEAMAAELSPQGIVVQVVYPGPIDTDLVNAPGEDPPLAARAGIARMPLPEAVAALMSQIEGGSFERWVPDHFREIYLNKVQNPEAAIANAAAWFIELERQVDVATPSSPMA